MKKLLIIALVLLSAASYAQPGYTNINSRYNWIGGRFQALHIPAGGTPVLSTGQFVGAGALYLDSTGIDSGLYYYHGGWVPVGTTPFLQQVFDKQSANSSTDKDDTISIANHKFVINSGSSGSFYVKRNSINPLAIASGQADLLVSGAAGLTQNATNTSLTNQGVFITGTTSSSITGKNSAIVLNDSITIQPPLGKLNVDSLRGGFIDTAKYKPIGRANSGDIVQMNSWAQVSGGASSSLSPIGDIGNTTIFPGTSIPSGWTQLNGSATISYNDGVTMSGSGTLLDNYVKAPIVSTSNNYSLSVNVTVNTKPANYSEGLTIARFGHAQAQLYLNMQYAGFSDSMRLSLRIGSAVLDSTARIAMANGNTYNVLFVQSNNTMYIRISLLSSGNPIVVKDKLYVMPVVVSSTVIPNQGKPGLILLGGSYKVTSFAEYDYDLVGSDLLILGTSITQGYYANSFEEHYVSRALEGTTKHWINYGDAGATGAEMTLALSTVYLLRPTAVGIEAGVNDAAGNLRAYFVPIIDSLQAHGIDVFWIKDYVTDAGKDSIIQNICTEQGILLINAFTGFTATDLGDASVHPNSRGFLKMAQNCKAQGARYFGTTGSLDGYTIAGLKDVALPAGGTLPADGDLLQYNGTTSKWVNAVPTTSRYINNQIAIMQNPGNFWISGSGVIGAKAAVGAAAVDASYQFFVSQNTSNGQSFKMTNDNNTSSLTLSPMGSGGFSITGWANAGVIEATGSGGLALSAQGGGPITFQVGASRTVRGSWNTGGELIVGTTDNGAFTLQNNGAFYNSGNVSIGSTTTTDALNVNGNLSLLTAGNKIKIATGTNASVGVSGAMTAGTITISTTAVTASSRIFLTHATLGGTQGILSVGTITAGTSFVINSSSATDTGTVNWWIVN